MKHDLDNSSDNELAAMQYPRQRGVALQEIPTRVLAPKFLNSRATCGAATVLQTITPTQQQEYRGFAMRALTIGPNA